MKLIFFGKLILNSYDYKLSMLKYIYEGNENFKV